MIRGAQAAQLGSSTRLKCPTSADRTSLVSGLRRTPFTSRAASAGSTFGHAVIAAISEHFPPREQVKASMRNTLFGSSAHFILGSIRASRHARGLARWAAGRCRAAAGHRVGPCAIAGAAAGSRVFTRKQPGEKARLRHERLPMDKLLVWCIRQRVTYGRASFGAGKAPRTQPDWEIWRGSATQPAPKGAVHKAPDF